MSNTATAPPAPRGTVRRRTLMTGAAGASLALLGLSACTDEDPVAGAGPQEPDEEAARDLTVVYR